MAPHLARTDGEGTSTSTSTGPTSPAANVGHLEGANRLAHFFGALSILDDGHSHDDVRIVQYGDSHTASDYGAGVFRKLLQSRFGDGGRGFVSLGRPWKAYVQDGIRGGMSPEFEPARGAYKDGRLVGDGLYGLLGVGVGASIGGARAWTHVASRSSRVEFDYSQGPRGGSFDVFVDGARTGRIATRAAHSGAGYFGFDLADAPHQVEVRTVGDGDVRVLGMALDRAQAGIVVDAVGVNGAQVVTLLSASEEHFAEQLRHRTPGLVVLAYGTNEALEPGLTDAEYERRVVDVLGRVERAVPTASCLLLGPPDLARPGGREAWKTWPRVLQIVAAQRRIAEAAGCAFYDQLEAMGGPGSIAMWSAEAEPRATRDRVHLTRTGYGQLATSFATDIIRAYDDWRAERGVDPATARLSWAKK